MEKRKEENLQDLLTKRSLFLKEKETAVDILTIFIY